MKIHYTIFKRKAKNAKGYDWYYTYTDPHTGVRKQRRCKDCATLREAREFVASLPSAISKSVFFGDFARGFFDRGGRWEREKEKRGYEYKNSTKEKKERILRVIILPKWANKDITRITARDIIEWADGLEYSNVWKNAIISTMRAVLSAAFADGIIMFNPLSDAPRYKIKSKIKDTLTEDEIRRCFPLALDELAAMYKEDVGLCALVMLSSGMRVGEAIALSWDCFDPDLLGLKIVRQWGVEDGFSPPKKNEYRSIILPRAVGRLLVEHKERSGGSPDDFIFTRCGRHLIRADFIRMTKKIKEITGKHITPHCLRHTYNTRLRNIFLRDGIGEDVLRAMTGHKSVGMTDHYDHPLLDAKMRALAEYRQSIDDFFDGQ